MTCDIQLNQKDVFRFQMYHNYHKAQTWVFILVGIIITGLAFYTIGSVDITYTLLYFVCGLLFIFYTPINLRNASKRAVRGENPLAQKIRYEFSDQGIKTSFAEEVGEETMNRAANAAVFVTWAQVYKVKETKKDFYLYTSPNNASILPKDKIADPAGLKELMDRCMEIK